MTKTSFSAEGLRWLTGVELAQGEPAAKARRAEEVRVDYPPGMTSPTADAKSTEPVAGTSRAGLITAVVALVLAVAASVAAPLQVSLIAATPVAGAAVAFLATLSLALSVRALFLRRRTPTGLLPALVAAVPAALALAAAGFLAFHERSAVLEGGPIGREHEPAMIAWQVGLAQVRARDLALFGLSALPGFALAALALGLALGARRAAKAKTASADAGTPAVSMHRQALAAAWGALLAACALVAAGLAVDALAIASPVEAAPHPRLADLAAVKEDLALARLGEGCAKLERVLAAGTPQELVDRELPGAVEIAHRCVGYGIEKLPKGLACVEKAAALARGATARLAGAEARVGAACDGALVGD